MSAVAAVLFDWAGTMIDFGSRAPVIAIGAVFRAEGLIIDDALIRRFMGMAKREHIMAILGEARIAAQWHAAKGVPWCDADIDALMRTLEPAMTRAAVAHSALVPGAVDAVAALRAQGVRIGSTTGYTRAMMAGILPAAAAQGYAPDVTVCAGETAHGRPAPLMLWHAMGQLGTWPARHCVAVDDATVGIMAGGKAGVWTIGVAASGNGIGLDADGWAALGPAAQASALVPVIADFAQVGADFVIPSVADLGLAISAIETAIGSGARPGGQPTVALGCGNA